MKSHCLWRCSKSRMKINRLRRYSKSRIKINYVRSSPATHHYFMCNSRKRTCKIGCGQEQTVGKCDTPGFPLTDVPDVRCDHRRSQRLYMSRNHGRLNQTSLDCLQSWRGNCDVQIIVYNCDPKKPDLSEIARVTDYVVAYSCKGNCTLREEREMTKAMALK